MNKKILPCIPLLIMGFVFFAGGIILLINSLAPLFWLQISGTIIETEIDEKTDNYCMQISYSYKVDSRIFTNDIYSSQNIKDSEDSFNCNEDIEKVIENAEEFKTGTEVMIYYNKDTPDVSFISFDWGFIILAGILLAAGIFPIVMYFYIVFNDKLDIQLT
jgi:hypothetical protein